MCDIIFHLQIPSVSYLWNISSGICPSYLRGDDIISIPLDVEEIIRIGVITHKDYRPTALGQMYLDVLHRVVGDMQSE